MVSGSGQLRMTLRSPCIASGVMTGSLPPIAMKLLPDQLSRHPRLGAFSGADLERFRSQGTEADGYGFFRRLGLWAKGLWWFWKPGGLFSNTWGYYFSYYRPGFHPWQQQEMPSYGVWLQTFERTGDAVAAGNALHAAGG